MEHQGSSLRSGHYVAYVRREVPQKAPSGGEGQAQKETAQFAWFRISDSHVKRISQEDVLRVQAYILLYSRLK